MRFEQSHGADAISSALGRCSRGSAARKFALWRARSRLSYQPTQAVRALTPPAFNSRMVNV